MEKTLKGENATREYGLKLAENLRKGDVIALIGDLGAGKTTLTKAIAEGLGVQETVSSPTFSLIKEYPNARIPLYHFDVYRLNDSDEMYELGFEEYFYGDGVTIVEWADKVSDLLPENAKTIEFRYGENPNERIIKFKEGEV